MSIRPLLLGHRGTRSTSNISENTIDSFEKAIEHGCDGFEFDVRLTADDSAVVCHDDAISGVKISLANRSELVQLASLEDVIRRYHRRVFLDIELKVPGLEGIVLQVLRDHPPERDYVVSSFLPNVVTDLRARSATVPLGIICEERAQLALWRQLSVNYVVVRQDLVDDHIVREIHNAGKKILVWTVNEKQSMLHFAHLGVDGIISDDTELLVRTLRKTALEDGTYLM
jgi:glycerophosphoryl diester phosphodiesterase